MMYIAAAYAMETATGKELADIFRERLWKPLGMEESFLSLQEAQRSGLEIARGYLWTEKGGYVAEPWKVIPEASGAGGVISNANDFAKWMRMLLFKTQPLSEKAHAEIVKPRSIDEGASRLFDGVSTYALGWCPEVYKGEKVVWHNGGLTGFGSYLLLVPGRKWGCAVMGNTATAVNTVATSLVFSLLDDVLEVLVEARVDFDKMYVSVYYCHPLHNQSSLLMNSEKLHSQTPASTTTAPPTSLISPPTLNNSILTYPLHPSHSPFLYPAIPAPITIPPTKPSP